MAWGVCRVGVKVPGCLLGGDWSASGAGWLAGGSRRVPPAGGLVVSDTWGSEATGRERGLRASIAFRLRSDVCLAAG